jgi:hypothetical protein
LRYSDRMSTIGWTASILGLAAGAVMGNQFRPLPENWKSMGKQKNKVLLETLAVAGTFGAVGAGIGYALTGCDCCPSTGGVGTGTPLSVPVTATPPSAPPPSTALPQGTPR